MLPDKDGEATSQPTPLRLNIFPTQLLFLTGMHVVDTLSGVSDADSSRRTRMFNAQTGDKLPMLIIRLL
jgi:hypothetical protein